MVEWLCREREPVPYRRMEGQTYDYHDYFIVCALHLIKRAMVHVLRGIAREVYRYNIWARRRRGADTCWVMYCTWPEYSGHTFNAAGRHPMMKVTRGQAALLIRSQLVLGTSRWKTLCTAPARSALDREKFLSTWVSL